MFYWPGGVFEAKQCWRALTKCFHPVGEAYSEKSNEAIVEMVRNTDLIETCRYANNTENILYCKTWIMLRRSQVSLCHFVSSLSVDSNLMRHDGRAIRSVTHDSLRYINILTYLLTYLGTSCTYCTHCTFSSLFRISYVVIVLCLVAVCQPELKSWLINWLID